MGLVTVAMSKLQSRPESLEWCDMHVMKYTVYIMHTSQGEWRVLYYYIVISCVLNA